MKCTRLIVFCGSILSVAACDSSGDSASQAKPFSGLNGTLTQIASAATLDECPNGGVTLEHGIDTDGDGQLAEKEVTKTYVLCHGKDGADGSDGSDGSDAQVSALQAELDALKAAVALNTAKVGITSEGNRCSS